jgi:hypothetical protein
VYPRCRLTWWMGDSDLTDYDRMRVDRRCTMVKGERCVMGVSVQGRRKEGHNTRREGVGGASVEQWRAHPMSPTPKIHCAHRPLGLRGMIATHYKKLLIALLSTIILSSHIQHNQQQPSISHNVCLCQSSTHSLTHRPITLIVWYHHCNHNLILHSKSLWIRSEYWQSIKKYHCKYCNIYVHDNKIVCLPHATLTQSLELGSRTSSWWLLTAP